MRIVRSHGWQGFGFSSLAACPAGGFSWQEFMDSPKSILEKPGAQLLGARNVLWLVVSSIPSRGLGLLLCIPLLGMMQKEPQMVGAWDVLWPWVYHIIFSILPVFGMTQLAHVFGIGWMQPPASYAWGKGRFLILVLQLQLVTFLSQDILVCGIQAEANRLWFWNQLRSGLRLAFKNLYPAAASDIYRTMGSAMNDCHHRWTSHPKHWQGTPL